MSAIEEKTLKVIVFSGKQEDWKFWEVKFLARARRKGFRELLLGKLTIPKDSDVLDATVPAEKKQIEIREANELAFEELVLSIDTSQPEDRVAFQSICSCRPTDYKNGNAADAWKRLSEKYTPSMAPMKLELKLEFQRMKLRDASQDPDVWISQLEDLRARLADMNAAISDDDFYIHILNNLPPEYEVQVSKLEERFGSTSNPLTVQDLRNELNLKFARLKRLTAEKTETDQALAAFSRYKGKCANCGKFGHKSTECWSKTTTTKEEGGETKKSKNGKKPIDKRYITCFGCGEKGHYKSECPELEEEEEETDVANSTLNSRGVVLMTASPTVKLPPTTWIADSGASTHITNEERGLYKKRRVNKPISLGNGEIVHATIVGKLDVTVSQAGRHTSFTLENV